jgi:DNA-binding NarL/FixJ family response regulator
MTPLPSVAPDAFSPAACLVVEDLAASREMLRGVAAAAFPGTAVVAVPDLRGAEAALAAPRPPASAFGLALVDLGLPDGSGVALVRRMAARHPAILPVVVTIYDDAAHLFDAIAAGARGYLLKQEEPAMLADYLRRIGRGEPPLSPAIAHAILAHFRQPATAARDEAGLTPREAETLALLARGLTATEAAAELGLKPQTVASYVKVIYQKLGVGTRAEATREAIRRGLA